MTRLDLEDPNAQMSVVRTILTIMSINKLENYGEPVRPYLTAKIAATFLQGMDTITKKAMLKKEDINGLDLSAINNIVHYFIDNPQKSVSEKSISALKRMLPEVITTLKNKNSAGASLDLEYPEWEILCCSIAGLLYLHAGNMDRALRCALAVEHQVLNAKRNLGEPLTTDSPLTKQLFKKLSDWNLTPAEVRMVELIESAGHYQN